MVSISGSYLRGYKLQQDQTIGKFIVISESLNVEGPILITGPGENGAVNLGEKATIELNSVSSQFVFYGTHATLDESFAFYGPSDATKDLKYFLLVTNATLSIGADFYVRFITN